MLHDFVNLGVVQGFVLEQTFCDPFELVAIRKQSRTGKSISIVEQFAHLTLNLLRGGFAAVGGSSVAARVVHARSNPGGHKTVSCSLLSEARKGLQTFFFGHFPIAKKKKSARIHGPTV